MNNFIIVDRKISVEIDIRREADGVVRTRADSIEYYDGGDEPNIFWWVDGNAGCDCNRSLFFARAAGEDDPDDCPCGDERFRIRIRTLDGKILHNEWE